MFLYKTEKELEGFSPTELINYKKALVSERVQLLAKADKWTATYIALQKEINMREYILECALLEAKLDRKESNNDDYGIIGWIQ